jgi:uncharacterized protein (DUF2236 family)
MCFKAMRTSQPSIPETSNRSDIMPIVSYHPVREPAELRRISKEMIFLLGGQFAILMQWTNPAIAIGSKRHSRFASRMLTRLKRTSIYMTAAVYGTLEESETICSVIHKQHSSVKGGNYNAHDPELHRWTSATLFMALVVVYEAFYGEMPCEEKEALYLESSVFATSLRMPTEMWPKTLDEFYEYWYGNINNLSIVNEAKELCEMLTRNNNLPWYMRWSLPLMTMLTAKWLPPRLRKEYGLPDPDTRARRLWYYSVVTFMKYTYRLIPKWIRQKWHQINKQDMQRTVEEIQRTGCWPI